LCRFAQCLSSRKSLAIQTVLDHARFRVLLNKEKGAGSIQTAIDIYRQHGLRKLYLGFNATWLRESFLGIYFGLYDSLMSYAKREKLNLHTASLISGGLAGVATWATMYPVDYAKTILQGDSLT
jgi:solute carrier family 25 carnitine/acylcarnitine transporter 20/29